MHDLDGLNVSSCINKCNQGLCKPGACSLDVQPLHDLGNMLEHGTIQRLLEFYPASLVFFNSGIWFLSYHNRNDYHDAILREVMHFRSKNRFTHLIWKGTSATQTSKNPLESHFVRTVLSKGVFDSFFDTWSITVSVARNPQGHMWDRLHFEYHVYQGLNKAFLLYLCSLS